MTEAIFTEEPIQFYSAQMKKFYLPPEIKTENKKRHDKNQKGESQRRYVKISDDFELVIPDTYEKEKWETKKTDKKERLLAEINADESNKIQRDLTESELAEIRFDTMNKMFDKMKEEE